MQKKFIISSCILFIIFIVCIFGVIIHLVQLKGATKSDLKDYSLYPVMEVSLAEIQYIDSDDNKDTYHIKWDGGNFMQNVEVEITHQKNTPLNDVSSEQVNVKCKSLFFKQVGESVNIIDGVIYINVTGHRKTLFYTGNAEEFGFAIKIKE